MIHDVEIVINSGVTDRQRFREIPSSEQPGHDGTGDYPPLHVVYPLAVPVRKRSAWRVSLQHLAPWHKLSQSYSDEGISTGPVDASQVEVEMTYQVAFDAAGCNRNGEEICDRTTVQGLQCLLVCQQMYEEARRVFYSKNKFTAADHTACVYFLKDRPEASQSYIRSLAMHFDERAWTESFGSEATTYCDMFEGLCRALGGPTMNLRELEVIVFGDHVDPFWTGKVTVASCLRTDKYDTKPPFLEDLVEIKR